jgi:hypothetical protein
VSAVRSLRSEDNAAELLCYMLEVLERCFPNSFLIAICACFSLVQFMPSTVADPLFLLRPFLLAKSLKLSAEGGLVRAFTWAPVLRCDHGPKPSSERMLARHHLLPQLST